MPFSQKELLNFNIRKYRVISGIELFSLDYLWIILFDGDQIYDKQLHTASFWMKLCSVSPAIEAEYSAISRCPLSLNKTRKLINLDVLSIPISTLKHHFGSS